MKHDFFQDFPIIYFPIIYYYPDTIGRFMNRLQEKNIVLPNDPIFFNNQDDVDNPLGLRTVYYGFMDYPEDATEFPDIPIEYTEPDTTTGLILNKLYNILFLKQQNNLTY